MLEVEDGIFSQPKMLLQLMIREEPCPTLALYLAILTIALSCLVPLKWANLNWAHRRISSDEKLRTDSLVAAQASKNLVSGSLQAPCLQNKGSLVQVIWQRLPLQSSQKKQYQPKKESSKEGQQKCTTVRKRSMQILHCLCKIGSFVARDSMSCRATVCSHSYEAEMVRQMLLDPCTNHNISF